MDMDPYTSISQSHWNVFPKIIGCLEGDNWHQIDVCGVFGAVVATLINKPIL